MTSLFKALLDDSLTDVEWKKKAGLSRGIARLLGSYFVDPVRDFVESGAKGIQGQATIQDNLNILGGLMDVAGGGILAGAVTKPSRNILGSLGVHSRGDIKKRMDRAQKHAALPVEKGGLGLPADNTALDRANVMFPEEGYHGTSGPLYNAFEPQRQDNSRVNDATSELGVWIADDPDVANEFAFLREEDNARIIPLRVRSSGKVASFEIPPNVGNLEMQGAIQDLQDAGYDLLKMSNYTSPGGLSQRKIKLVNRPNQVRSRFAAFDPFEIDSPSLLAGIGAGGLMLTHIAGEDE